MHTKCRFNFYMYKKGHTGMIKVKRATEEKPGTLEIKVRIGGNEANTGNVKDLKQLSGEASAFLRTVIAVKRMLSHYAWSVLLQPSYGGFPLRLYLGVYVSRCSHCLHDRNNYCCGWHN